MENISIYKTQSDFQSRMLRNIDDDVAYLRRVHTMTDRDIPVSLGDQLHHQRNGRVVRGGCLPESGFAETPPTPDTIDITPSSEDESMSNRNQRDISNHSMNRRSSRVTQLSGGIQADGSMNDNLPFSEMSFSDDESSDESYDTETSQSDSGEVVDSENTIRFELRAIKPLGKHPDPDRVTYFQQPRMCRQHTGQHHQLGQPLIRMQQHLLQACQ